MSSSRSTPYTFFCQEFKQALEEQTFGILDSRIVDCKNSEVVAKVTLLENRTCTIKLSIRGYELLSNTAEASFKLADEGKGQYVFESLDELLQAVSPLYLHRRAEAVARRLARQCAIK